MKFSSIFIFGCIILCFETIIASNDYDIILDKFICDQLDENLCQQSECSLKLINRRKRLLNWSCFFPQPLKPVLIRTQMYYKFQSYRKFLTSKMHDFCEYMDGPRTELQFQYAWGFVHPFSNVPDSCPFEGLIYVRNLTIDDTTGWPILPTGQYRFDITFYEGTHVLVNTHVYFTLKARKVSFPIS